MGNSGGALVNTKGLLVGITSAIISPNGAYAGNSFAIPVSIVKKLLMILKSMVRFRELLLVLILRTLKRMMLLNKNLMKLKGALITRII